MTVRVSDEQLAALAARHEELGGDGPLVRCLRELQEAREALAYLFATYLPTADCNGPRDCVGTDRGCRHCVTDARLESAREALGGGS